MNVMPQFLEEEPEPLEEEIEEPEDEGANEPEQEPVAEPVAETVMPEVIKNKPRSTMDDIFAQGPIVKVVQEPIVAKRTRKKRVYSEEELEKLKINREKSVLSRKEKAREKQEIKDLEKLKRQKELNALRVEVGVEPKPIVSKTKEEPVIKSEPRYTQADVDKATLNAIMGYETIRKERKKEKLIRTSKEREEKRVAETIRKVIQPRNITYGQEGYFDSCF